MSDQSSEYLQVGDEGLYIDQVRPLEHLMDDTTPAKHWNLVSSSTSENRGYYGNWAIKNNALYLISIETYRVKVKGFWFWKKRTFQELTVRDLFPEAVNDEIKAYWFTGKFSAHTKSMSNPIDDRLVVRFVQGEVVQHQWYHLEKGKAPIPYEKPLH